MATTPITIEVRLSDHKPLVKLLEGLTGALTKIKEKHPELEPELRAEIESLGKQYDAWMKADKSKWGKEEGA